MTYQQPPLQRQAGAGRRPQQVNTTIATIVVILAVLCCGGAGLTYALTGSDDDTPNKATAVDVPAATPAPATSSTEASTPSPAPSDDVPGYLAGLKAISTRLATNQDTAVARGRTTCLDITQGKARSIVVTNVRQRFAGTIAVTEAMAGKIVDVAQRYLCPTAVIAADPPRQPTPTTDHGTGAATDGGTEVYYKNCAAVKAAGKAPLRRGQPGYRSGLDGDGDGVACET